MLGRILRRLLVVAAVVILVAVGAAAWFLAPAHLQIRRLQPPLPSVEQIRAAVAAGADGPVRLSWINTSSQATPRSGSLGAADPHPDRPYRLCHSSFVLEWADGRTLLIDAGMTRAEAESFGALGEWVGGGPVRILTTVAETLGAADDRADGIVFTHLHVDHVDGVRELCDRTRQGRLAVWMTPDQRRRHNYTTKGAFETLQSVPCAELRELPDEELAALPDFPGVFVVRAAGHTPGSQVVIAALRRDGRSTPVVFTGDVANNLDGILLDIGKPALYSALIVPEDDRRLGAVRRLIRALRDEAGFEVLVSHDELALAASSIGRYPDGVDDLHER